MINALTYQMLALIAFCILTEAAREVCFKKAAHNTDFSEAIKKPLTWLGIFFWAVELIAWTVVLEHVPLSIAFPLMSLVYVVVVASGVVIFKEKVNFRHALGSILITAGVACVGVTGV